ncbi:MAG TPA: thioesterase family protein [Denitromonas sp.]|uniref:acyl-CoA thioesterase n=1 Tax=Denitromonas sp. TaxID=2734609 RepID=UPI001D22AD57|nr:acyl-CoA thioesterase [Rhodocyclaceae bacterium]MCP5220524.1 acyl-CoA thioesterase [Zoogloeaceae bacterium]HQU87890.1 thioesterase family protein [Denitromonas sp.]HQV14203.1 thioesterase family protein [Denitromonas sp.]
MTEQRILLHTCRIPVRWGDMDAYGHVNNTIYFRYCEQARVEWLEADGFMVSTDHPDGPVIINAACTFMIPVTYPATVIVRLYAGAPGRSSLMNWYEISVEGEDRVYAEGSAKVVWMNHLTGKSVPLPESLRKQFEN